MYSLTCIVLVVSLMYYAVTVSKVIVMRITLQKLKMSKIQFSYLNSSTDCILLFFLKF